MRLFTGIEAEGRYAGWHTLFVSGNVPFEEIEKEYRKLTKKHMNRCQVYFGADDRSYVNWKTVEAFQDVYNDSFVTVEIDNFKWRDVTEDFLQHSRSTLFVYNFDKNIVTAKKFKEAYADLFIKVLSNNHYLITQIEHLYFNSVKDKLYKKDKTVWSSSNQ